MTDMRETCKDCGTTWGVTMTPRTDIRCTECARPKPWRDPQRYWACRVSTFGTRRDHATFRSPQWWNEQTELQDLTYAAHHAPDMRLRS